MKTLVVLLALVACSREEPRANTAPTTTSVTSAASAAPAKGCLPVVAAECGCTYSCGTGTEASPGKWNVIHPTWATHALTAKIAPWCVSGDCTDAFHAELPCDIVCAPKPADHTCHFEGDRCVSGQKP